MQRTNGGLPSGMPGMADEIPGTIQQAPQPVRQSKMSPSTRKHRPRRRAAPEEERVQRGGIRLSRRIYELQAAVCIIDSSCDSESTKRSSSSRPPLASTAS